MDFYYWCIVIGLVFILMALSTSLLKRLPLTSAMIYLVVGLLIGPLGLALLTLHPLENVVLLERLTESAVLISLFTTGLKLRLPLKNRRWILPVRLASLVMLLTIVLITLLGVFWLQLPLGAAILLGAILAPTDPVLASDVQVDDPDDRDAVRFGLTGEAGLNDGSAFPFVMLGLGLLGYHELGDFGLRWLSVDVVWSIVAGLGLGALLGSLTGRVVLYLRKTHQEAVGLDNFLVLGLIALSYGLALVIHSYGFLAVFAAGVALRRIEIEETGHQADVSIEHNNLDQEQATAVATNKDKAPVYLMHALLSFNEQLERIAEVGIVLLLGGMLVHVSFEWTTVLFAAILFLLVRPGAVYLGMLGSRLHGVQRRMMGWFGIRGIGSVYYLMYSLNHGLAENKTLASQLLTYTLVTITLSIFVHGISVTPLMNYYRKKTIPQVSVG